MKKKKKNSKWSMIAGAFALGTFGTGLYVTVKTLDIINAPTKVWLVLGAEIVCVVGMLVANAIQEKKK